MFRSATVFGFYLSFAIAVGAACSNGGVAQTPGDDSFEVQTGGTGNSTNGGSSGTGTSGGSGGSITSGGAGGSITSGGAGGSITSGGSSGMTATGGTVAGAGHANTGGTGGTTGGTGGTTGGTTGGSAGKSATGGGAGTVGATGGSAGTVAASGGSGGMATGSVTCDTAFAVGMDGFVRMPAKDGSCWHGYAYGTGDGCSSTGCTGMTTIEYCGDATAKNFTTCKGMLSISGTLNSSTDANKYLGFVLIGFSVNEPAGGGTKGTVVTTGTGIVVTGTAAAGRVQLQNGSTYYCAAFTSGTVIPYTTFNTKCYDSPPDGVAYAVGMPIDTIALQIPGGMAAAAYSIAITSVKEM